MMSIPSIPPLPLPAFLGKVPIHPFYGLHVIDTIIVALIVDVKRAYAHFLLARSLNKIAHQLALLGSLDYARFTHTSLYEKGL